MNNNYEVNDELTVAYEWIDTLLRSKIRVHVLGSCFSRLMLRGIDFFNVNYKKYVSLDNIFYHSSYVSLTSSKITVDLSDISPSYKSDFNTFAEEEFDKSFFERLEKDVPQYLIIDNYADACCNLIRVDNFSYYTKNYYLENLGIENKFNNTQEILFDSTEKWELLKQAIVTFYTKLSGIMPLERVILVRAHRAEKKRDEKGNIVSSCDKDYLEIVKRQNAMWDKVDNFILSQFTKIKVIDMRGDSYLMATEFPLNISPSHYEQNYYRDEFLKLNRILIDDYSKGIMDFSKGSGNIMRYYTKLEQIGEYKTLSEYVCHMAPMSTLNVILDNVTADFGVPNSGYYILEVIKYTEIRIVLNLVQIANQKLVSEYVSATGMGDEYRITWKERAYK